MNKRFTLVELLLVIAVLGILLTILLPSLSKAKQQAQNTVCKNSLKQHGVVLMQQTLKECKTGWDQSWAVANRKVSGAFPYYRFWLYFAFDQDKQAAEDFVKQAYCPLERVPINVDSENSYVLSRHVMKEFLARIDDPSEKISYGEKPTDRSIPISVRHNETTDDRHILGKRGYSNVLLVDGHIESGYFLQYVDQTSGPHF